LNEIKKAQWLDSSTFTTITDLENMSCVRNDRHEQDAELHGKIEDVRRDVALVAIQRQHQKAVCIVWMSLSSVPVKEKNITI